MAALLVKLHEAVNDYRNSSQDKALATEIGGEMGPRSSFYSLAGKRCEEPSEQPDNGELVCSSVGDFLYCSIKCNSNKQLFKYSFGSSCNPSSLKWSPEEVLIDCVG